MKRINLSISIPRLFLGCLAMVFCLVQFSSCERETEVLPSQDNLVPVADANDCVEGTIETFPLKTAESENPEDYVSMLVTGSFYLDECLCRIFKFQFTFDEEIPHWGIAIKAKNGFGIPFDSYYDGLGNTIVEIDDPEILASDQFLTAYLDLVQYSRPEPIPALKEGNGLCIIENIGGVPPPAVELQAPHITNTPDGNGNTITKVYIPASMGI